MFTSAVRRWCHCGINQVELSKILAQMGVSPDKLKPQVLAPITVFMLMCFHILQQRSTSASIRSDENGSISPPDLKAPIRGSSNLPVELPKSSDVKMTLSDFTFLKVLGKGSFGKVF